MSKQVNFYAGPEDLALFHTWLLAEFPGILFVWGNTNRERATAILPLADHMNAIGHERIFLIPSWAADKVVFYRADSLVTVNSYASPVIEYTPPLDESGQCLKVGRVYFAFTGPLEQDQKEDIDLIFSWLRLHSVPYKACPEFRVLPSCTKYPLLRGWVGKSSPNPHFGETILVS